MRCPREVREPELTNVILDNAVHDPVLERWYPLLETATKIDERGVERLMCATTQSWNGGIPCWRRQPR